MNTARLVSMKQTKHLGVLYIILFIGLKLKIWTIVWSVFV